MIKFARLLKYSVPTLIKQHGCLSLTERSLISYHINQKFCSTVKKSDPKESDDELSSNFTSNTREDHITRKLATLSKNDNEAVLLHDMPNRLSDEEQKYRHHSSFIIAKKLGELESPESLICRDVRSDPRSNDQLFNVPISCIHFNHSQFPSENSLRNWIKAIDLCVEHGLSTPLGICKALHAFSQLVDAQGYDGAKLLKTVGFERYLVWFQYPLKQRNVSEKLHARIALKCVHCIVLIDKFGNLDAAFKKSDVRHLISVMNDSFSTSIPTSLDLFKDVCREDELDTLLLFWNVVLLPIYNVEFMLDQHCLVHRKDEEKIIHYAIRIFYHHLKYENDRKGSLSRRNRRLISMKISAIGELFGRWQINNKQFWTDWFEHSLNKISNVDEDELYAHKALQSMLMVLLQSNLNPAFLRKDDDFAEYLTNKIKPEFCRSYQKIGRFRFINAYNASTMKNLMTKCLQLESDQGALFNREELQLMAKNLDNYEYRV